MRHTGFISKKVLDCAFEVSNRLGVGFLESVYENAMCVELRQRGLKIQQQKPLKIIYKGEVVGNFVTDIIVEKKLLIELKVVSEFNKSHKAQLINYLKATGIQVGLLLNFGTPKLGIKRIVYQYSKTEAI